MLVLLNGKRLEAALPDMAAGTVRAVVAADMAHVVSRVAAVQNLVTEAAYRGSSVRGLRLK